MTRQRTFRGRKSKLEEARAHNAAIDFYNMPERFKRPLPKVRAAAKPSGKPLEKNVLGSVLMALRHDPRVALVERTQSGLFQDGNRHIRVGSKGKLDITGMLKSGKYFEIECKRDEATKPDERQTERIAAIRANGGISGWCWSAESALALLP